MSLNLKELFTPFQSWVESPIIKNPLWMSIIIICFIILIAWFVMHKEIDVIYDDSSFNVLLFKVGVWGFITTMFLIFLHNKAVKKEISNKYKNVDKENLIEQIEDGVKEDKNSKISLKPKI